MTKKNPSILWTVDQHEGNRDIGEEGRLNAQTNIGIGGIVSTVGANKFVTGMKRNSSNDLEYVSAQPALSDLVTATADRSVVTNGSGAITVDDMSYSSPRVPSTGTTTSLEFIDTVSQGSTGKISATKKKVSKSDATDSDSSDTLATSKAVYSVATDLSTHTHGNITNDGKIGSTADLALVTTTDGAITTANLSTSDPTASGSTLSFIDTISQNSKGKITVTKKSVSKSDAVDSNTSDTLATSKAVYTLNNTLTSLTAFSNVKYGSTTIAASSASDTINVDKSGPVTLTADATNKKLTIGVNVDSAVSTSSTNPLQNSTITSTFIETVTFDSSTSVNEPGTVTLKYHKPTGTSPTGDTYVYSLSGDLNSGIVIRHENNSNPHKFIFQNQRPIPTYTGSGVSGGDVLMVNSSKTGLEWGTPDPVCEIKVQSYMVDPDTITFNSNGNTVAHIDTSNVDLGYLAPDVGSDDDGKFLMASYDNGNITLSWEPSGSGNGDVVGPATANNNHIPLYDGTTGKLIKNSKFYFTDEAQADSAEASKQVKTKAYDDPFRTSQQIVRASQGSGYHSADFAYLYIKNKYRNVAFGISSYGNIKITEFVQSGADSVSPSSEQDIITSSGTGNSTKYLFKGTADTADALTTSSIIGSTSQPVYLKSDGTIDACNFRIVIGELPTTENTIAFL